MSGIYTTLRQCGDKALPANLEKIKNLILSCLLDTGSSGGGGQVEEEARWNIARCYASLTCYFDINATKDNINELLSLSSKVMSAGSGSCEAGRVMALAAILQSCVFMSALPAGNSSSSGAACISSELRDKAYEVIRSGFSDDRVNVRSAACAAVSILTSATPLGSAVALTETQKQDQKSLAISIIHLFADAVAGAAADPNSGEVRKSAMVVIKEVSQCI
jgi:hypothetical protein